jgi:hypothetical protein
MQVPHVVTVRWTLYNVRHRVCVCCAQVANYRSFAEQRAAQLGRTFDSLIDDIPAAGALSAVHTAHSWQLPCCPEWSQLHFLP